METQTPIPSLEQLLHHPPPILLFFPTFLTIYLLSYHLLFKHWPPTTRPEAASCAISFLHGTPAFLLSSYTLLSSTTTTTFSSPNTPLQSTLLEFSISYFLTDLLHYLLFYPSDLFFTAHHLATLFVFSTCRYLLLRGAHPILILLALAESTSALQNAWTLARAIRFEDARAERVYGALSVPFYAVYGFARGVCGPVVVYWMWVDGGGVDGSWVWVWWSWIGVVVVAIGGSLVWVSGLWVELFKERLTKKDA